ncbi:Phosphoribosylamine--glycine ligase [Caloramator mitchellensis]|uniref:Phosphoribosylamine--glycine ligase n=1 Tax=Caloramator mitchellensis TaxID=908809 RepID=A0A0R3JRX9_CALMK|nr:phosphoribosylamine--glycine ligase [Caloramator mitchellensis]KRQ86240.1 Phosphoribosylamine--glycine ligase [Caloramator mitchellensis]
MKVLIIGSGGREHAIAWKIAQSSLVEEIFVSPGNGGTAKEAKCQNIDLKGIDEYVTFVKENKIDVTVIGPEAPLVEGIVDEFKKNNLKIFGPSKTAANLEGSKIYAKEFMKRHNIRTAEYEIFYEVERALEYIKNATYPCVIKADGLAQGKGVVICNSFEEAKDTLEKFMVEDIFKGSGKRIVIEEFLEGVEASILSITDGKTIIPFISAKDHKRIFDKDMGPNTGGMGVVAPNPYVTEDILEDFRKNIMIPTIDGIKKDGLDYCGIIFFGIMITKRGAYLLEYNVRMGDPETQAVLPLMKSDFFEIIFKAIDGKLEDVEIEWEKGFACNIVAASKGYPGEIEKGFEIRIGDVENKVFIAGAKLEGENLITTGGRVLSVTAIGETLEKARAKAYADMKKIYFEGMQFRGDI